jgi:ATP-dependent RNA helicase DeaD
MTLNPNIAPALARALEKKGFASLTEVQHAVLASDADGADLLVSAQTGSGKTAAFGMAIAPTLLGDNETFEHAHLPLALVVAPTRELALQVQRELVWLYGEARGRVASCVGGMDPRSERKNLQRGCHIVVGTPGRLRDHIERGALDMSALRAVVLDEADEMLDFGFREDLEFILDASPQERRTLMFSATVPRTIANMAKRYQRNAQRISTAGETKQHLDIEYRALAVAPSDRENAIINTLRFYDAESAIVFCGTRQGVNHLSSRLGNRGFAVVSLSGELSQKDRTQALQAMRDGRARVCVATDVAARGIDLPGLELVIHADLPTNSDTLKHRSGRTGRAGKKGVCTLIIPHNRRGKANSLLRGAKIEAEWGSAPSLEDIKKKDRTRLLSDETLTQTYDEDALAFARELLEKHGAEQVAAAFLNRKQTEMPAAEELTDAPAHHNEREPKVRRDPFKNGVWFKLTAGRKERAEPRWLLPLICRLGHITKRDVGSIKIGETESHFEISSEAADRFMEAVTAAGGGEKSIRITREGSKPPAEEYRPELVREPHKPSVDKAHARKKAKARPATSNPTAKPPVQADRKPLAASAKHRPATRKPGPTDSEWSLKRKKKKKPKPN